MSVQINAQTADPAIETFDQHEALTEAVAEKLLALLVEETTRREAVHIALTGGGTGIGVLEAIARLLAAGTAGPDWTKVQIWWGDERLLPESDADRNDQQAFDALLSSLISDAGLPESNVHPIPTSEDAANPDAGAEMYAHELEVAAEGEINGLQIPPFAVMLLGVGPDGHINSLFPGKDSLQVSGRTTVGEYDAPAELGPPLRVSLTFDAVHTAERVWLVTAGESKQEAVRRAFSGETPVEELPAKNARGARETVWHLDSAAAATL